MSYITKTAKGIITDAANFSIKYKQNWCNLGHVFLSLRDFLLKNSNIRAYLLTTEHRCFMKYVTDPSIPESSIVPEEKDGYYTILGENTEIPTTEKIVRFIKSDLKSENSSYTEFANDFLNIMIKYKIDGINFTEIFLILNPVPQKELNMNEGISYQPDILNVTSQLERNFAETQTEQDVYDLVQFMFSDRTYQLAQIFDILGEMHTQKDKYMFRTPDAFETGAFYTEILDLAAKYKSKTTVKTLKDLDKIPQLTNLNRVVQEKPCLMYNVEDTIDRMEIQLNSAEYPCLVLVGNSGVGKTSVVRELARRINEGEVSDRLKDKVIYELNINDIVAGSKYRGDFENRCKNIFEVCKKNRDALIFIDEGHMIASAGGGSSDDGGGTTLGNIIKPYISNGDITIITATTDGEYKHFEKDKALCGRFQKIAIQEPSNEITKSIIQGVINKKQKDYNINLIESNELVDFILEEGTKYLPNEANPKRSLKLLDGAFAYASKENKRELCLEDLKMYLRLQYNVTISENKAFETKEALLKELLGQDKAIERVYENLEACELGIVDPKKPLYSMILGGSTGVGKTHTAKAIAKYFFGNENNVINIDMSQYSEAHTVSNLIGAAKGYVGYNEETALIGGIKQNPNSVVIFDEIEKAHPNIFPTFLRILDEGELDDARGNKVSFRNAIIIFTTNLGFNHDTARPSGAGLFKETAGTTNALPAIKKAFKPEFLGRINDIIIYDYLTDNIVEELIYRATKEQMSRSKIKFDVQYTEDEIKAITKDAKVREEGARNISNVVRRYLTKKLIEKKKEGKAECTI